ncbi:hypothetical protein [Fodinicola acaciae]|uniref:hypothetical protein n=1 Tax=Fodinicola acaciae TaxID=2681555 RepID=UPI0013D6957B|nr:hypothetical protein [Fodinicola acaciae]
MRTLGLAMAALVIAGVAVPGAASAAPTIDWKPCADAPLIDCGSLAVPLDYRDPRGQTVKLALERHKAGDQAHKIGSLFVNPGGPGGSGRPAARSRPCRSAPATSPTHWPPPGNTPVPAGKTPARSSAT